MWGNRKLGEEISFSVDTSVLINIFDFYYPAQNASQKKIMDIVFENLSQGGFYISDIVLTEFRNKEIVDLIKKQYPNALVPSIKEIQDYQRLLDKKYPNLINPRKQRNQADLFVVAVTKIYGISVLTSEISTIHNLQNINKIPNIGVKKIPEICLKEGIDCYDLPTYLATLI